MRRFPVAPLRLVVVAALALVAWSCRDFLVDPGTGGAPGTARTLRIVPSRIDLAVGSTARATATLLDAAGAEVAVPAGLALTFTSSAPATFAVDGQGTVMGLGAGEGVLRAAVGALAVEIPVHVATSGPSAHLAFTPDTLEATLVAGTQVVAAVDVREASGLPAASLGTVTCDAPAYEGAPPPAPWLVVQACDDSVRVLVQAATLPAGTWRATIPVRGTLAGNSPATLPVEVVVTAAATARLGLVPGIAAGVGYTNGPSLRVAVDVVELTGVGEAALGEVRCLEQTGNPEYFVRLSCGDSIVYELRTGGNLVGVLEGSVRVTAANVTDTVTLPLRVTAARPAFRFVPDSLDAQAQANGAPVRVAAALVIDVLEGAPAYPEATLGTLACTLVAPDGAPTATVARCDADSVAVTVTPGAAAGSHRYTVQVRAPDAPVTVLPDTLPVNVTVAASTVPIIAVSPAGPIAITTTFGNDGVVVSRRLDITNAGGGTLTGLTAFVSYGSEQLANWIEVEFDGTTAPTALFVDVLRYQLPPGTYDAIVRVSSTVAGVQTVEIPVQVTVVASTAQIGLDPDSILVRSFTGGPPVRAAVAVVELTGQGRAALGTISCGPVRFVEGGAWVRLVSCGDSVVVEFNTDDNFNGSDRATVRVTGSAIADSVTLRLQLIAFPPRLAFVPDSLVMTQVAGGEPVQASARPVEAGGWLTSSQLGPMRCTVNAPAGAPTATVTSCDEEAITVQVTPGATAGAFRYTVLVEPLNTAIRIDAGLLPVRVTITAAAGPFEAFAIFGRCAFGSGDGFYCWGDNASGQVGDGTTVRRLRPSLVRREQSFLYDARAGDGFTCGRGVEPQMLLCWGSNASGATGQDSYQGIATRPEPVSFPVGFNSMGRYSVGAQTTCAIIDDGTSTRLYCWGNNAFGQLGDGSTVARSNLPDTPVALPGLFTNDVAVGTRHACAIAGAAPYSLYCWGQGPMLGNGSTDETLLQRTPVNISFPDDLPNNGIVAGGEATCVLNYASTGLYCWGANRNGEAGTGTTGVVTAPTRVIFPGLPDAVFIRSVVAGTSHTCAIAAGETFCWGRNDVGQLGGGDIGGSSNVPRRVTGGHQFTELSVNGNTTCGLRQSDNTVWCWGYGQTGELGNGTEGGNSAVPVRVIAPPPSTP